MAILSHPFCSATGNLISIHSIRNDSILTLQKPIFVMMESNLKLTLMEINVYVGTQ